MKPPKQSLHLGTSGWSYKAWVGPFYERGTQATQMLTRYSEVFNSVEVDSTFYGIPSSKTVQKWSQATPETFRFCPKVPRVITHEKKLVGCEEEWASFLNMMDLLGDKLGPMVLQFRSDFHYEHRDALKRFAEQIPKSHRVAIEVRHLSWLKKPFLAWLREQCFALVLHDYHRMPRSTAVTAEFVYLRLLGRRSDVPDDFSKVIIDRSSELRFWSRLLKQFQKEDREIFAFSNNRFQGHAPSTAHVLRGLLDL
ncbi:MAG: DUF72 domain-containing protein [Planctomycetota bacterium]|nr:DUF72 domain-containing protein [Planctomycetota bacterium]MDA1139302.1 DUF72 domain-containing protein [Planctomycetota bacterium]